MFHYYQVFFLFLYFFWGVYILILMPFIIASLHKYLICHHMVTCYSSSKRRPVSYAPHQKHVRAPVWQCDTCSLLL